MSFFLGHVPRIEQSHESGGRACSRLMNDLYSDVPSTLAKLTDESFVRWMAIVLPIVLEGRLQLL